MALAVGAAGVPLAAASASPIVTQVNSAFPATISFDGTPEFSFAAANGDFMSLVDGSLVAGPLGGTGSSAIKFYGGAVIGPTTFAMGGLNAGSLKSSFSSAYYIGLEVAGPNGLDYYGYAEIGLEPFAADRDGFPYPGLPVELIDYAFESQPGVSITTPPLPEPGSLALLAAGAAGALSIRRRLRTPPSAA